MFRSVIAFTVFAILGAHSEAFNVPNWSPIQAAKGSDRLKMAKKLLDDAELAIPDGLTHSKDIEKAQLIYFLDAHLERLNGTSLKCNSVSKFLADAKELSVTREEKPESLSKNYSEELQKMLKAICD